MTDRVQQMIESVRDDFGITAKKPRKRRSKAMARADIREGILKKPENLQGLVPESADMRGSRVGYSEPRRPEVWRNAANRHPELPVGEESGLNIDPAASALATFQAVRRNRHGSVTEDWSYEELSADRPRMEDLRSPRVAKQTGRGKLGLFGRKSKVASDSVESAQFMDVEENAGRRSWILPWRRSR